VTRVCRGAGTGHDVIPKEAPHCTPAGTRNHGAD
jgi:hypothetical protein